MKLTDAMGASESGESSDPPRDLARRVQDLERRVLILEERLGERAIHPITAEASATMPALGLESLAVPHLPPNVLPVLGRVILAIAGAYVLRALSDLGVIPRAAGMAVGVLYALAWLFLAARLPAEGRFAILMMSSTSVLIIGPLVWEACVRLRAMSTWTSAGVLAGFAFMALALSWRKSGTTIPTVVLVSSTLLAAALLLATYDLLPFALTLLALAAAAEFGACRNHLSGSRWISAAGADSAVLLFSWLMARDYGLPEGYVPTSTAAALAAQLLLIALYITMAIRQTLVRRRTLTFPEMAQTACALLIGIGGVAWVFKTNGAAMLMLGISSLIGGVASYAFSFRLFDESKWNFRAWASYGLFLVLAGTYLLFSGYGFWGMWCGCAVVCCCAAMAMRKPTLGLHGAVYLLLGSAVSGASSQPLSLLLGIGTVPFQWLVCLGVLAASMISWVAIARSWPGDVARWRKQAASFVISANIVWILSGIAVRLLILIWQIPAARMNGHIPADTLGTLVLTTFVVALALAGTRWRARELLWLAYGLMGLGAWKLAARDFMNEHNFALVISLLSYGSTLILLPRMMQRKRPGETAGLHS